MPGCWDRLTRLEWDIPGLGAAGHSPGTSSMMWFYVNTENNLASHFCNEGHSVMSSNQGARCNNLQSA